MTDLKVPPHDIRAEQAILGQILLEKHAFETASEIVTEETFYQERHQDIFSAIVELKTKGSVVDMLTVSDLLRKRDRLEIVGGIHYLSVLTDHVVSSANLKNHCRIIAEKHILREIARIGQEMFSAGYDEGTDAFELVEKTEKEIFNLTNKFSKGDILRVDSVLVRTLQRIEQLRNREQWLTGVPSGFSELDKITCGWQETDLIILAARPACGKTAFSLNLLRNAANVTILKDDKPFKPFPVGLFNLEMSSTQVVNRLLSNESNTPLKSIRDARLDEDGMKRLYSRGVQKIAGMDIYLDDTPSLNVYEFKAKARRMVERYGVRMIVLDYLQLMKPGDKGQSREQQIATISRELKITAKELKVPIIALSQLSREVERRGGPPTLADLRESGAIEQDADMVIFLYGHTEAEILGDPMLKDEIFARIAKHRNGSLETLSYLFERDYQRFIEKGAALPAAMSQAEEPPF